MIQANYVIKVRPIVGNFILERFHQAISNIIHIFKVNDMLLDNETPWDCILALTMFALFVTAYTMI